MSSWVFSSAVVDKARDYIDEDRVKQDAQVPMVWWVQGSDPSRRYRVQTDADPETMRATWITCTCPHGLTIGAGEARCSHAVAVLLLIQSQGENGPQNATQPCSDELGITTTTKEKS